MKRIAFKTLGCRLNQFETEAIASKFFREGYKVVKFNDEADVYIVNTCTVTNQSDKKSLTTINSASKKNNSPVLVVTGCMANNHNEKLDKNDHITYLIKNEHKSSIFSVVNAHFNGELYPLTDNERDVFGYQPPEKIFHTRSNVKIQDGCDNFCSFCIIPMVRGRAISRSMNDILDNVRADIDNGYKEITLTGVNISRYNYDNINFSRLIEKVLALDGDFRLRISSLEPDKLDERFIDLFAHPKMCPHLHLCLQSGSDKILLRMRRMYTMDSYLELVNKIRMKYPDFNFTTDVMVGFPGETEQEFEETHNIVKEVGFSHVHTFKYSVRNGTKSARMSEQISERIKEERSRIIRDAADNNKHSYYKSFIGKRQTVIPEKKDRKGFAKGYGEHYLPVMIEPGEYKTNTFVSSKITGIDPVNNMLSGTLI